LEGFSLTNLEPKEVNFSQVSIIDDVGKIFFYEGKVFRAIYSREYAELYTDILQKEWINEAFDCGLVRTKISEKISLEGSFLTLEHEGIPFETHSVESTNHMHWLAAKATVEVAICLSKHGFILKDAHPWNVMFNRGIATFIDFGSIEKSAVVPMHWLKEFRQYFCVPIWLASAKWSDFAREYRREHANGFGLRLFESKFSNRLFFNRLNKLSKYSSCPIDFFKHVNDWLERHKPVIKNKEYWANYQQCGGALNPLEPEHPKQKFVYDILNTEKPAKVLDFAANKGYYSEMAALLGAAVIACDYEEYCVDQCLELARHRKLPITPALLDFSRPTPCYGVGLYGRNSVERFSSDIVLALGLVHHICITQKIPVEVFCDICMRYSEQGVVLEYVDPTDKHVASWGSPIPANYSINGITRFMNRKFPRTMRGETIIKGGLCRIMMYFGNE
jgi:hypothetical protein